MASTADSRSCSDRCGHGFAWIVSGGCLSLAYALLGILFCATIIGFPYGRELFYRARCVAWPFDKQFRVSRGCADCCQQGFCGACFNVPYLLFGYMLSTYHAIFSVFLIWTIVGIPFAEQHQRLALLAVKPLGVEGVEAEMKGTSTESSSTDPLMEEGGSSSPTYQTGPRIASGAPEPQLAVPVAMALEDPPLPPSLKVDQV